MSQIQLLQTLFVLGAILWVGGTALFLPRYVRAMRRVKDPRKAPFLSSIIVLGIENLFNTGYYIWVLFFPPDSIALRMKVVFIIPIDFIFGALAYLLFNYFVTRHPED